MKYKTLIPIGGNKVGTEFKTYNDLQNQESLYINYHPDGFVCFQIPKQDIQTFIDLGVIAKVKEPKYSNYVGGFVRYQNDIYRVWLRKMVSITTQHAIKLNFPDTTNTHEYYFMLGIRTGDIKPVKGKVQFIEETE